MRSAYEHSEKYARLKSSRVIVSLPSLVTFFAMGFSLLPLVLQVSGVPTSSPPFSSSCFSKASTGPNRSSVTYALLRVSFLFITRRSGPNL